MILADTSAWVEWLRGTGSAVDARLDVLLREEPVATTDAVLMEILGGAGDAGEAARLRRLLLGRCEHLRTAALQDFEAAADVYRACRRAGETVRSYVDCLIAAIAIRAGCPLLQADSDFERIARHTPLQLA